MLCTVANLHPHWTQEYTFIKAIPLLLFKSSPPTSQPHSQTAHAKHSSGRSSRCRSSLFQSANVDTIMLSSFRVISFERHIKQSGKSYHSVYWIRSEWCYITNSINYCSYKWTRNQTSPLTLCSSSIVVVSCGKKPCVRLYLDVLCINMVTREGRTCHYYRVCLLNHIIIIVSQYLPGDGWGSIHTYI